MNVSKEKVAGLGLGSLLYYVRGVQNYRCTGLKDCASV